MSGRSVLYGEQTRRALEAFGPGPLPREFIKVLGEVKKAAVLAQFDSRPPYPQEIKPFLVRSLDEVISGDLDEHFPLSLKTGSAGTSLHFNMNEVAAARANELIEESGHIFRIHPTDHLNMYQSTNDVLSTALSVIMVRTLFRTEEELIRLQEKLVDMENRYDNVLVTARTELQDALPMKLGQVFGAYAGPVERDRWRVHKLKERCRIISLGGTAVGTCFSAPREYVFAAEQHLRRITGLPLARSQNLPDAIAHTDIAAEYGGALKHCADSLFKICGDIAVYTSSFSKEMKHPEVLYGSTIMAAKTNPVLTEFVRGLALDVAGEEAKISAYVRNGQLQLNANMPFVIHSVLTASESLEKALRGLRRLFDGLEMDKERMEENLFRSPALISALRPWLPYTAVKELNEKMETEGRPGTRKQWEAFICSHTDLTREFIRGFLDMPALTGFYHAGEIKEA